MHIKYTLYINYAVTNMSIIIINSNEKYTTIRLSERTKMRLESLGKGKETHEKIILRLIKIAEDEQSTQTTEIVNSANVSKTKYYPLEKTLDIEIDSRRYSVVCKYNDLSTIVALLRNGRFQDNTNLSSNWEISLELVNIREGKNGWEAPQNLQRNKKEDYLLLYFAALKQIIEEIFNITIFEIMNREDYLQENKWRMAYNRYGLSSESLHNDVERVLMDTK